MLAHAGTPDEQVALVIVVAGLWIGWAGLSRIRGRGFPRVPIAAAWALAIVGGVVIVSGLILPRQFMRPNVASATPTGARPTSSVTLTIDKPVEGAIVDEKEMEVVMSLPGGKIIDTSTTVLTPDTGHIHLSLDGRLVSMTYGLVQLVDISGLTPGTHTLEAEFVAADHGPFDPRVTSSVTFTKGPPT